MTPGGGGESFTSGSLKRESVRLGGNRRSGLGGQTLPERGKGRIRFSSQRKPWPVSESGFWRCIGGEGEAESDYPCVKRRGGKRRR